MTNYNGVKFKSSDFQLDELKSAKNATDVTLVSSEIMGTDETNFLHSAFLSNAQIASLPKAFINSLSKDIEIFKTQLPKKIQSGRFFGRFLEPLLKVG